jgi:ABC-type transport system involved in cytochrome bd biosynthesis fused ATPase/permease subunit
MFKALANVLVLYRIAAIPRPRLNLAGFLLSNLLLSILEMIGLASIGALLVQLFGKQETIDLYFLELESIKSAAFFILAIWISRAVLVVMLNRYNHAFIQRIKSGLQSRQCDVAFGSKARSDQSETGQLFTALTNEVQMITGQVFIPGTMALAEAILVLLFASVAVFVMPVGVLVAGVVIFVAYYLAHKVIGPMSNLLGKARIEFEKDWTEKVVNMFSLRREAEVYGVTNKIKNMLVDKITYSNTVSGKFYSIAPLNRAILETAGIVAILGLLISADQTGAKDEQVMFVILALVRMLPSATRILSAVQSYRFASPVVEKQIAYLDTTGANQKSNKDGNIKVERNNLIYYPMEGVVPEKVVVPLSAKGLYIIIGESGLGKTTMLEEIVDILLAKRSCISDINYNFSYASQNNLVTESSIAENIAFYRDLSEERLSSGIKLLHDWGIPESHFDKSRSVTDFSGGQKKRVTVARALNCENAIIVLDEPTSGLDPVIAQRLINSIRDKARENLIILTTHDRKLIDFADTIINLRKAGENC